MSDHQERFRAIARITDDHETRIERLRRDVDHVTSALSRHLQEKPAGQPKKADGPGQPDWLSVTDPEVAQTILDETALWVDHYGRYLGLELRHCWPWHPQVVVLIVAAAQHYRAVYAAAVPPAVTDFLTVRMRAIRTQSEALFPVGCRDTTHEVDEIRYTVHLDELPALATWWATDRTGLAPGLTSRIAAA